MHTRLSSTVRYRYRTVHSRSSLYRYCSVQCVVCSALSSCGLRRGQIGMVRQCRRLIYHYRPKSEYFGLLVPTWNMTPPKMTQIGDFPYINIGSKSRARLAWLAVDLRLTAIQARARRQPRTHLPYRLIIGDRLYEYLYACTVGNSHMRVMYASSTAVLVLRIAFVQSYASSTAVFVQLY